MPTNGKSESIRTRRTCSGVGLGADVVRRRCAEARRRSPVAAPHLPIAALSWLAPRLIPDATCHAQRAPQQEVRGNR
eukprot:scaffold1621_cov350-Prasinococcus_capsulatus_cf.AAC.27